MAIGVRIEREPSLDHSTSQEASSSRPRNLRCVGARRLSTSRTPTWEHSNASDPSPLRAGGNSRCSRWARSLSGNVVRRRVVHQGVSQGGRHPRHSGRRRWCYTVLDGNGNLSANGLALNPWTRTLIRTVSEMTATAPWPLSPSPSRVSRAKMTEARPRGPNQPKTHGQEFHARTLRSRGRAVSCHQQPGADSGECLDGITRICGVI